MAVRSVVIGAGEVSESHLSAAAMSPLAELVAVCDLDEERARAAASEYGIEWYTDVEELLAGESPDLVQVCTPVQSHLPIARAAIEAGVAVVIEKPAAETVAEVEQLQALSHRHDVPVTVVHQHLFSPAVREARRRISDGELGEIRAVELMKSGLTKADELNRGSWVEELPGGEFEEGLPHHIYPLLAIGGYPQDRDSLRVLTDLAGDYEADYTYDNAQIQYVTDSGTFCSSTMLSDGQTEHSLHVQGADGSLTVDLVSQVVTRSRKEYYTSAGGKVRKNVDACVDRVVGTAKNIGLVARNQLAGTWETRCWIDPHAHQFREVVTAIETEASMPVPLEEARWTIAIMEVIREEGVLGHERSGATSAGAQQPANRRGS